MGKGAKGKEKCGTEQVRDQTRGWTTAIDGYVGELAERGRKGQMEGQGDEETDR